MVAKNLGHRLWESSEKFTETKRAWHDILVKHRPSTHDENITITSVF